MEHAGSGDASDATTAPAQAPGPGGLEPARMPRRSKGRAVDGTRRDRRVNVSYSSEEYATVAQAAAAAGLSPGAWLARTGLQTAQGQITPLPSDLREHLLVLIQARIGLSQIGNNLNQIAAALNTATATGIDARLTQHQVDAVLDRVQTAIHQVDEASIGVSTSLKRRRPARAQPPEHR